MMTKRRRLQFDSDKNEDEDNIDKMKKIFDDGESCLCRQQRRRPIAGVSAYDAVGAYCHRLNDFMMVMMMMTIIIMMVVVLVDVIFYI